MAKQAKKKIWRKKKRPEQNKAPPGDTIKNIGPFFKSIKSSLASYKLITEKSIELLIHMQLNTINQSVI